MTRYTPSRAAVLLTAALFTLLAAATVVWADEPTEATSQDQALDPRIVGGVEVDPPGKYPFIVALVFSDEESTYWGQYCGGTLIDPWWVLTAGHCVTGADMNQPWEIDVVVGRHDLRNGTDGERIGVADIFRHPGYDNATLANDLALVRLERAATAGTPIALASVADAALYEAGDMATVIGWGATYNNPPGTPNYPDTLREVNLPFVSDADCVAAYGSDLILPDQICAGDLLNGGIDSCYGDSGGPLFVDTGSGYLEVGIVSTGNDCALPGWPGIYTRVPTYKDWVDQTLADNPLPTCSGQEATLLGTRHDDTLWGTEGDDVIVARSGDDTIRGLGGNDLVCAGTGGDWVDAGAGSDTVFGSTGADYVLGGLGSDFLAGDSGRDRLFGGEDDDRVFGGADADTILGDGGADFIYGGDDGDRLFGGSGNDFIAGYPGDDELNGGTGHDRLFGNEGFDVLFGGLGTDTCWSGEDVVCETLKSDAPKPL